VVDPQGNRLYDGASAGSGAAADPYAGAVWFDGDGVGVDSAVAPPDTGFGGSDLGSADPLAAGGAWGGSELGASDGWGGSDLGDTGSGGGSDGGSSCGSSCGGSSCGGGCGGGD
jgi:hypothetical protein